MNRRRRPPWLSEAIIVATLMLLPLLFWWRLWALDPSDRAAVPQGDFTDQYYPLHLFAARELSAGRLPAWDPYINAGQPGLADIQTGFFYPPNVLINLFLVLSGMPFSLGVLTAQIILHFSLASLFTYLFVRSLACRAGARTPAARFAGAVAAITFSYSGYLTSFPVQQLTILETAIWLPLVLLFVDRAVHQQHARPQTIAAGAALACALLAGHPQTAMYIVYATLAYGLFLVWTRRHAGAAASGRKPTASLLCGVLLPLGIAGGLAAVQLAPTLTFIARSTRAGLRYDAVAGGLPPVEMIQFLYPGYFGGSPQYAGILPAFLAVAAFFVPRVRRQVLFWASLGMVALLLSFGGHTFFYNVAYLLAPGFGAVRNQERIIYLFSFSLSVLAGYGALTLVQPLPRMVRKGYCRYGRGLAWLGVAFLALTALFYFGYVYSLQAALEVNLFEGVLRHHVLLLLVMGGSIALIALRQAGSIRRSWLMALALGLIWLNLFTINWRFNQVDSVAGQPFSDSGLVTFLREQSDTFRISSAGLLPGGASAGIVYELEDITGNTPLQLDAFEQFEDRVGSWRRWQLLNVHYVLRRRDLDGPGLERVFEEGEIKIYRMTDPLPRAWVVHNVVVADDEEALDRIGADDFDPRLTAIVPPGAEGLSRSGASAPGAVAQVIGSRPGKLVLNVSSSEDGLLVVSQPYYSDWQARVDGERTPIYRVDSLLQGVPVQAGRHRVELDYHLSLVPGLFSSVMLIGCLVGLAVRRQRFSAQASETQVESTLTRSESSLSTGKGC